MPACTRATSRSISGGSNRVPRMDRIRPQTRSLSTRRPARPSVRILRSRFGPLSRFFPHTRVREPNNAEDRARVASLRINQARLCALFSENLAPSCVFPRARFASVSIRSYSSLRRSYISLDSLCARRRNGIDRPSRDRQRGFSRSNLIARGVPR